MATTYTQLRSGDWGLRVEGSAKAGDRLTVTKKSGEQKVETIDRVIWSGNGIALCSIRRDSAPASPRPSSGYSPRARSKRPWRPCGYPGCNPTYCDECDGQGG